GATVLMDVWTGLRKRMFHAPSLDYALVGRWIGHMAHGRFRHESIAAARPVRHERELGWLAHYATGVLFAAVLVAARGADWVDEPTLAPALLTGLVSVAAPFLVMQPAFGLGVAASRTPRPSAARWRSLVTHAVFGLGLFLAAEGYSYVVG